MLFLTKKNCHIKKPLDKIGSNHCAAIEPHQKINSRYVIGEYAIVPFLIERVLLVNAKSEHHSIVSEKITS